MLNVSGIARNVTPPRVPLRPGYRWVNVGGKWETQKNLPKVRFANPVRPITTPKGNIRSAVPRLTITPKPPARRPVAPARPKARAVVAPVRAVRGGGGGAMPPPPYVAPSRVGAPSSTGPGDIFSTLMDQLNGAADYGNSDSMAEAQVNAAYEPMLQDLARQMAQARAQADAAQASIGNWYGGAISQAQGMIPGLDAETSSLLAGTDAANAGAAAALGGGASDAAGSAAAFGAITRGELAKLGESAHSYASGMIPVLSLQGGDAKQRQAASDVSVMQDLAAQIADANYKKIADTLQAKQDGRSNSMKDKLALINAYSQLALLPGQLKGQNLDLLGKQSDLKSAAVSRQLDQLRLKLGLKNADTSTGAVTPWGQLNPEQLASLRDDLVSKVVSKQNPSQLAVDPIYVYNQWGNALRGVSNGQWDPKTSAAVRSWRDNQLASYLPLWNKKHPKLKYSIRNGQLVRIK
jgi:hypothetical protein